MIVVSHRGPVTFSRDATGGFEARRGAGGVVSALAPLLAKRDDTHWIAAAITPDDHAAVAAGASHVPEFDLRLLELEPAVHRLHYDVVSNATLWFLFHGLFDLARRPRFDRRFREAWEGYELVNRAFADAIAEVATEGEVVLVQDLHLMLVPGILAAARPDLAVSHFSHTPFCGPGSIRVLPEHVAKALCGSLSVTHAGFHTPRWARAFGASATEVLGHDTAHTYSASFGPDADALALEMERPEVEEAIAELEARIGDRALIVRSDRMEPSKNIVRGFYAYDLLLEEHPELRNRVVFAALLNPSRGGLPEYQAYGNEVEQAAARVNERWGTADWEPVWLDTQDNFARSLAGFARSDVLLVNPVKDGLNLVAMEGPMVNRRDGVLCLSREAGAFDVLESACVAVQPFDIVQTAEALHTALTMEPSERATRAAQLRELARSNPPASWLDAQISHARA